MMTLRGILAVLLGVSVLFVAPVTVLLAMQGETTGGLEPSEVVRNWTQVVQGVATVAALVAGAVWTLYIFGLGRSFSASVQIQINLERVVERSEGKKGAIISVTLKNVGRTQVIKEQCRVGIESVADSPFNLLELRPINASLTSGAREYPMFESLHALEPDQEVTENVMFTLGEPDTFKVAVRVEGLVLGSRILPGPRVLENWNSKRIFNKMLQEPNVREH